MKKIIKLICIIFLSLIFIQCQKSPSPVADYRWTEERAWQWHSENGWMVGTNFNPTIPTPLTDDAKFMQRLTAHQLNRVTAAAMTVHREAEWQGLQKLPLEPQDRLKAVSPLRDGNPSITAQCLQLG